MCFSPPLKKGEQYCHPRLGAHAGEAKRLRAGTRLCRLVLDSNAPKKEWTMDIQTAVAKAADLLSARTVFGDSIQQDGVIVIPAAKVRGGAGLGAGPADKGSGGGFSVRAMPAGAFLFKDGKLRWKPAIDVNRIILGGQLILLVALLMIGSAVVRRR